MRTFLCLLLLLVGLGLSPGLRAADAEIHVNRDSSDGNDHATRLAADFAAAKWTVKSDPLDPALMPFVSQVRYYGEADLAQAERALEVLKRYRTRAVLVPMTEGGSVGRIDVYVSTQDDDGSAPALQAAWTEPSPWSAPSLTDEAFRLVFDPEDRSKDPLKSAPAPAKAFLAAAKQADAIDDDLKRCLAYPNLPGNDWSPAVVTALCEYGHGPALSAAQLRDFVARKDVATLEARLQASLARHFAPGAARSEVIHRELAGLDPDTIRAWRELAPMSPFALAAQAEYLAREAWRARGDGTMDTVTPQQYAQMRELARLAITSAQGAVGLEPKLMPAWVTLAELSQLLGDDSLRASVQTNGWPQDPGSYRLNLALMNALRPRWGGGLAAMDEWARGLSTQVATRPLLAVVVAMPDRERGLIARDEGDHAEMARVLLPLIRKVPDAGSFEALAEVYTSRIRDGQWAGVAYGLQAVRFGDCAPCVRNSAARDLRGLAGDLDWAVLHVERLLAEHPDDVAAQLILGDFRTQQKRYPDAIRLLEGALAKAKEKRQRHDALELLAAAHREAGHAAQAEKFEQQMAREDAQ